MLFTTIRSTLIALIGSLGLVVLTLVAIQLSDLFALYNQAQQQFEANIARSQVAHAAVALARERDATFLALATGAEVMTDLEADTDRWFAATHAALSGGSSASDEEAEAGIAAVFLDTLSKMRADAAAAMLLPIASPARQDEASRWFEGLSLAIKELRAMRLRLLNQAETGENLSSLYHLRTLTLILLDEIMKNDTLLQAAIARQTIGAGPICELYRSSPQSMPRSTTTFGRATSETTTPKRGPAPPLSSSCPVFSLPDPRTG